jgi:hypothetical protein
MKIKKMTKYSNFTKRDGENLWKSLTLCGWINTKINGGNNAR